MSHLALAYESHFGGARGGSAMGVTEANAGPYTKFSERASASTDVAGNRAFPWDNKPSVEKHFRTISQTHLCLLVKSLYFT